MIHTSHSIQETAALAEQLISYLKYNNEVNLITLSGDLGSGKTAFTKCIANVLNISEHITSPTFVIQKKYPILVDGFPFKTLVHIDTYRLEKGVELTSLKFDEELEDPTNLILLEWPEKVAEILPEKLISLKFSFINETTRSIEFPDMIETNEAKRSA